MTTGTELPKLKRVILIEKTFSDTVTIRAHYSEYVNKATIKMVYKNKPTIKYQWTQNLKADVTFDTFKEFISAFLFKDTFNEDEIISFLNKKMEEIRK